MAVLRGALKGVRKYGAEALKFIGLVSVADFVSGADDGMSDAITIGVIGLVVLLLFGGRR